MLSSTTSSSLSLLAGTVPRDVQRFFENFCRGSISAVQIGLMRRRIICHDFLRGAPVCLEITRRFDERTVTCRDCGLRFPGVLKSEIAQRQRALLAKVFSMKPSLTNLSTMLLSIALGASVCVSTPSDRFEFEHGGDGARVNSRRAIGELHGDLVHFVKKGWLVALEIFGEDL